jgi:hypothetical protein
MRELQQNRGNGSFSEVLQIAPHWQKRQATVKLDQKKHIP